MVRGKSFLALITARKNSKGVKNKNRRLIAGRPLIEWAIQAAKDSKVFDRIIVVSDCPECRYIGIRMGVDAQVEPDELAKDTSMISDVLIDSLARIEKEDKRYDYVHLIQPTSPDIRPASIVGAVNYIIDKQADMVMGVYPVKDPTAFCKTLPVDLSLRGWYPEEFRAKNRQMVGGEGQRYSLNGYIYIAKWDIFAKKCDWWKTNIYGYVMNEWDCIDIDNEWDFQMAELRLLDRIQRKGKLL